LGLVQLGQQRFVDAAATFFAAIRLKPDFGPAYYNRGFALARAGHPREAIPVFREAMRLNPERIDSYLMLADIHLRLGENSEAGKFLLQAEPLNPTHAGLRQLREKAQRAAKEAVIN
jgi:tetratricopeptide (TPR) repeat protein